MLLHSLLLKGPSNSRGTSWIPSHASKAVLWPSHRRVAWVIKTLQEANNQGAAARQAVSQTVSLRRSRCWNRSVALYLIIISVRARKILIIKMGCSLSLQKFSRRTPRSSKCRIRDLPSVFSLNQVSLTRETYHKSRVIQHHEIWLVNKSLLLSRRKHCLRAQQVPTTKCRRQGTPTTRKLRSSLISFSKIPTAGYPFAMLPRKS